MQHAFILTFLMAVLIQGASLYSQSVQEINPMSISYTVHDGIPSNNITYLYNDSKGRMWVGTEDGLVSYDGRTLNNHGKNHELEHSLIVCIKEDESNGVLWVVTSKGRLYSIKDFEVHAHPMNDTLATIFNINFLKQIGFDQQGNIIGCSGFGIYTITPDSVIQTHSENTNIRGAYHQIGNQVFGRQRALYQNDSVSFFLRDTAFVYIDTIDHQRNTQYSFSASHGETFAITVGIHVFVYQGDSICAIRLPSPATNSILFDQKGGLWVGTHTKGAFKIENGRVVQNVFSDQRVHSICEDFEGGLWFGLATEGIRYVPNIDLGFYLDRASGQSIKHLFSHRNELFWITANGDVHINQKRVKKNIFRGEPASFSRARHQDSTSFCFSYMDKHSKNELQCLSLEKYNSTYWDIGPFGIHRLLITEDDTMLFGYELANTLDSVTSLTQQVFPSACNDVVQHRGHYWLATDEGVIRASYKRSGNGFFNFEKVIGDSLNTIRCVKLNDRLLVISDEGIVYEVDDQNAQLKPLTKAYSNIECLEVKNHSLFLGLSNGLALLDMSKIGTDQRQPERVFFGPSIQEISVVRDTIFMATGARIMSLPLTSVEHQTWSAGKLSINAFRRNQNWSSTFPKALKFFPDENLAFHLTAVSFRRAQNFKYFYRLLPSDTSWYDSRQSELTFFQLPPNDYTLQAKLSNGRILTLPFVVAEHWYQTTWFITSISILLTLILLSPLYFRNRMRIVATAVEREKDSLRMKTLANQLKPHFVFNALNSIQSYVLEQDVNMAATFLAKFAMHIRSTLEQSRNDMIKLSDSIESINTYLELEKLRTRNKFDHHIHIDNNVKISAINVPPLLIQPYVENAIVHGFAKKREGGLISINVKYTEAGYICISIIDNGSGLKTSPEVAPSNKLRNKSSLGTKINAERIETLNRLYKERFSVSISDATGGGVCVVIMIPFTE